MAKKRKYSGRRPSYLNMSAVNVMKDIAEDRADLYAKKFKKRIEDYYENLALTGSAASLECAGPHLDGLLEKIPISRYLPVDVIEIPLVKKVVNSFDEYMKLRETMSHEEILDDYEGPKPGSIRGYKSRLTRLSKKRKPNKKMRVKDYGHLCELLKSGLTYEEIQESSSNSPGQIRSWYAGYGRYKSSKKSNRKHRSLKK